MRTRCSTDHAPIARAAALTLILTAGACADATGPRDGAFPETVVEDVATFLADSDPTALLAVAASTRTGTHEIERSAECPAGGSQTLTGTSTVAQDPATRVVSSTWTNTHTQDDCAFSRTRGDRTVTVVIDGEIVATGSFSYRLPEQRGDPRVLLAYEITREGATTTTARDRTERCEIDTRETYDPATGRFSIEGLICGRSVSLTRDPTGRGAG